jgi:septal ring factor EnvC (AmiA/AmiB activator)
MIGRARVTKIEQLEKELNQKTNELNESLHTQCLLRETLKNSTKNLEEIEHQLKGIEVFLRYSNECVHKLKRENRALKLSCDGWMKRAIKLEFKVLNVLNGAKK